RVPVLAVSALANAGRLGGGGRVDVRMELGAPRVRDAMDRPEAAVLREVGGGLRMPVLGEDDRGAGRPRRRDLAVDDRDDVGAAVDRQAALRVGEVILEVDDDEGRPGVVPLHVVTLAKEDGGTRWGAAVLCCATLSPAVRPSLLA